MNLLKLIPTWAYWLAIAALVALVGVQQVRISGYQADVSEQKTALADLKAERDQERADRAQAALDYATAVANLKADHARQQNAKEMEYATKLAEQEKARRLAVAESGRLRSKLAAYVAGGSGPGAPDAAAGQRAEDRLATLARLLDESIDLVAEGRSIIERRDGEVAYLLDTIRIDRAACEARVSASGAVTVQVGDVVGSGAAGTGDGVGVTPEAVLP